MKTTISVAPGTSSVSVSYCGSTVVSRKGILIWMSIWAMTYLWRNNWNNCISTGFFFFSFMPETTNAKNWCHCASHSWKRAWHRDGYTLLFIYKTDTSCARFLKSYRKTLYVLNRVWLQWNATESCRLGHTLDVIGTLDVEYFVQDWLSFVRVIPAGDPSRVRTSRPKQRATNASTVLPALFSDNCRHSICMDTISVSVLHYRAAVS